MIYHTKRKRQKTITQRKKGKNDWADDRWVRWRNNERICSPDTLRCKAISEMMDVSARQQRI